MPTTIEEFFGFPAGNSSKAAIDHAARAQCPFIDDTCTKTLSDRTISGVCTLKPATSTAVICCPTRLYADDYRVLRDVSERAFGPGLTLQPGEAAVVEAQRANEQVVAVFGKRWGGELRLPQRQGSGSYFVDWVLARLSPVGELIEFVAVEVQSIDTTGNYRDGRSALLRSPRSIVRTTAGFNWENVNKRILPQVIYKGNVLQREQLCTKGLFFVVPDPVYVRILQRLGGEGSLLPYPLQSSSITFLSYDLDAQQQFRPGQTTPLRLVNEMTTNIGQLAQAFAGPGVMPPRDCYRDAIKTALQ